MAFSDTRTIRHTDFEEFGRRIGLPEKVVRKEIELFLSDQPLTYELLERSFLSEELKSNTGKRSTTAVECSVLSRADPIVGTKGHNRSVKYSLLLQNFPHLENSGIFTTFALSDRKIQTRCNAAQKTGGQGGNRTLKVRLIF